MRLPLALVATACSAAPATTSPMPQMQPPDFELVESQPIETALDTELPDTFGVWFEMIAHARRSIDLAQFYASNAPGSRLDQIVDTIEQAITRGVRVRFLVETSMIREYHDTVDRLQRAGAEIRALDLSTTSGGILHAKYLVVDDQDAFVGSQNFDWRALEHIQELGARCRAEHVVTGLRRLFAYDWALAGGETWADPAPPRPLEPLPFGGTRLPYPFELVASPAASLPVGIRAELPALVSMIAGATRQVRVQLLSYRAADDHGRPWTELEAQLLAAASRGVHVQMLLADWAKAAGTIEGLRQLARTPNVEIRFATIPAHSGGFIPFARVVHAKLLAVDDDRAWIGSSNWERGAFYDSRNVGLVIEDDYLAAQIAVFADRTWRSPYVMPLDPDVEYPPPRVSL